MWMIEEMAKNQINFDDLAVGILPFGTGNDLARTLGITITLFVKINMGK